MVLSGNNDHDEGIASSKRHNQLKTRVYKRLTLLALLQTELGKQRSPLGPHIQWNLDLTNLYLTKSSI